MKKIINYDDVIALVETSGTIENIYNYNLFCEKYKIKKIGDEYDFSEAEKYWKDLYSSSINIANIKTDKHDHPMPVNIIIQFAKINNILVGFWEAVSAVVDYILIEEFLKENFKTAKFRMVSSTNFHVVLDHIELLNKKKGLVKSVN